MIQVHLVYTALNPGAIRIVEIIGLVGMTDKDKITNENRRPPLIQPFDLKAGMKISDKRHPLTNQQHTCNVDGWVWSRLQ